jgi:hypothetical protein
LDNYINTNFSKTGKNQKQDNEFDNTFSGYKLIVGALIKLPDNITKYSNNPYSIPFYLTIFSILIGFWI